MKIDCLRTAAYSLHPPHMEAFMRSKHNLDGPTLLQTQSQVDTEDSQQEKNSCDETQTQNWWTKKEQKRTEQISQENESSD